MHLSPYLLIFIPAALTICVRISDTCQVPLASNWYLLFIYSYSFSFIFISPWSYLNLYSRFQCFYQSSFLLGLLSTIILSLSVTTYAAAYNKEFHSVMLFFWLSLTTSFTFVTSILSFGLPYHFKGGIFLAHYFQNSSLKRCMRTLTIIHYYLRSIFSLMFYPWSVLKYSWITYSVDGNSCMQLRGVQVSTSWAMSSSSVCSGFFFILICLTWSHSLYYLPLSWSVSCLMCSRYKNNILFRSPRVPGSPLM